MDYKFKQPELRKRRVVIWEKIEVIEEFRKGMLFYVSDLQISQPETNLDGGYEVLFTYHPDLSMVISLHTSLGGLKKMNHKILS